MALRLVPHQDQHSQQVRDFFHGHLCFCCSASETPSHLPARLRDLETSQAVDGDATHNSLPFPFVPVYFLEIKSQYRKIQGFEQTHAWCNTKRTPPVPMAMDLTCLEKEGSPVVPLAPTELPSFFSKKLVQAFSNYAPSPTAYLVKANPQSGMHFPTECGCACSALPCIITSASRDAERQNCVQLYTDGTSGPSHDLRQSKQRSYPYRYSTQHGETNSSQLRLSFILSRAVAEGPATAFTEPPHVGRR
ncbi:hypothetical protein BESB_082670 [Besnoitia besnoiti]|uniref:Uncharacterized protein n=1 Tax=Besnoitia besnoiti TaxID=94643 RepID=A0A2A9M3K5_BESBE|nr:hypothetical protein BESB_082670 [Besnoitia besnoiti]PFH33068.1 hypothetical protein BESB_082670 [Besnoitia besnoiti]